MSDPGLAGVGAYAPRLRIAAAEFEEAWGNYEGAGIEEKAVPEADEDAVTMAYEATTRALSAAGSAGADVAHLAFATTTPPMAEEDLTARLVSVLGVPGDVHTEIQTGSTRAGAQALEGALDAGPWGEDVGLIVASDCPQGTPESETEHAAGAGAAAFVLSEDGQGTFESRASAVASVPGTRYRERGDDDTTQLGVTQYERDAFTSLLGDAVDGLEGDVDAVDAAAVQSPDRRLPYRATDALGVDSDQIAAADTVATLGDTGAASTFLGTAAALSEGADDLLVAAYGSGAGATAFLLAGAGDLPVAATLEGGTELSYPAYLRRRGEITGGEPEGGGAYVSVPTWQRSTAQRHRLVAGRCRACGALAFPPTGACRDCGTRDPDYEDVTLPGTGIVEAVTTIAQGGAPPEFVEQQSRSGPFVSAVIALDAPGDGETVSAPAQIVTGADESVAIGSRVETTIRRIYQQEGVIRYGFKAQLAEDER